MIKIILWDVDSTLLDFLAAERAAVKRCFKIFNLGDCSDEMVKRYSEINKKYWRLLENGEMTKPQILRERFLEFFRLEGIEFRNVDALNDRYQLLLGDTICYVDNSLELLKSLKGRVCQYAVTNGTRTAQRKKLEKSGFADVLDGVFISEEIGFEKPDKRIFDYIFSRIEPAAPEEIMIVGDSITGDMRGGNNAGIKCCWYNPEGLAAPDGIRIDFEIKNLNDIKNILF